MPKSGKYIFRMNKPKYILVSTILLLEVLLINVGTANGYTCFDVCACEGYLSKVNCRGRGLERVPSYMSSNQQASRANELDFSWNDIVMIPDKAFAGMRYLERVSFNSNYLDYVSAGAFNDSYMEYSPVQIVNFSDNILNHVPLCFQQLNEFGTKLNNLTDLILARNEIGPTIQEHDFNGVRALQYLDMSINSITYIEPRTFKYMRDLKYLDLRYNSIGTIPSGLFGRSSVLTSLRLTDNRLSNVPPGLPTTLLLLELDNNRITNLTTENSRILQDLSNVKILNLSRNGLREIEATSFRKMSKLKILDLSNNALPYLQSDVFIGAYSLEYIFLNRNIYLTSLPRNLFVNLPKLRFLFLYGCALKTLEIGTPSISPLSMDFRSSINSNNVEVSPTFAPKLEGIWLFGNPINCDCLILPLIWFINVRNLSVDAGLNKFPGAFTEDVTLINYMVNDGAILPTVETFCTTPFNRHNSVVGKPILEVPEKDLICPNQPFFVAVSMFLGIALFAAAIPVVFIIVLLYLCTVRVLFKKLGLSLNEDED